jgi:PTS system nitrogen regulatory IIA component
MHLIDLLAPARVVAGASVTSKKRLLELLANLLADGRDSEAERAIFDSLCAREKLGSTGLGQGVAIPHGRSPALTSAVGCFVRLGEPIDFGAPDSRPVDLMFALGVPEHFTNQHLLLLSQLAELFSDSEFTTRLRQAPDSASLFALLSDWQLHHAAA